MNTLIKELAVEAGAFLRPGYVMQPNGNSVWTSGVRVDHTDMDLEKFAMLIVEKCAAIAEKYTSDRIAEHVSYQFIAEDE